MVTARILLSPGLVIFCLLGSPANAQGANEQVSLVGVPSGAALGKCENKEASLEFGTLLLLENATVRQRINGREWLISLNDLSVHVEETTSRVNAPITRVFEIRRLISGKEIPDVDLKLAMLNGQVFVYWRETFRHRQFRVGLFKFSEGNFVSWCEGTAGMDVSH
jgi:hypothetical protein